MAREVGAILKLDTKEAKSRIQSIEKDIKNLKKNKVRLETDLSKMNKMKSDLETINNKIQSINNRKISLSSDYSSYQKLKQQLDDIEQEIIEIGRKKLSLNVNDEELKQLNSRLKELKQQKSELKLELKGLSNAFNETNKLNRELDKLDSQKVDIETKLKGFEDTQSKLNKTNETIGKLEANKADIRLDLENYNQTMQQLNNISSQVKSIKNLGNSMSSIGKGMTNIFSGMSNNPIGKFGHFLVQGIGYSSLYRLTSGFMNSIENSFSSAIKRMDTLANANRTFKAMDFDDSVIQSSIDDLENRILGLPTTLDDAMQSVTMISAINGDLPKSVRIFDAINNSILAFGGNAEKSKRAITQFSQAMGTGKLDARTYLSLTDAGMSPALAKVAEMLGYVSGEMNKFKSDLGQGVVPLEEFTDALIKLNENGYDTMKALNSLAKENAVKSIGSAMTVASTQMTKGWTSIVQTFSDIFNELGYGTIAENIAKGGNYIREQMQKFSQVIKDNKEAIGQGIDFIVDKFNQFKDMVSEFDMKSFLDGLESFKWVLDGLKASGKFLFDTGKNVLELLGGGNASKGLGRTVASWFTFGYAMRFVGKSMSLLATPMGTFTKFMTLLGKGGKKTNFASKFSSLFGKGNKNTTQGMNGPQTSKFDKNSFYNSMGSFAKMAIMAGEIMLYAEAIKQLNEKVPNDIGSLIPKLANLGLTVGAIGGITLAMGKVTQSIDSATQITGILSMIGTGGVMWVMAEAIGNFDKKVPSNIGDFASKMANFSIAIGGFGLVIGALGGLAMAGGGLGALVATIGGVFTMGLAGTMVVVANCIESFAHSMEQVATSVDNFSNINLDKGKIDKNIGTVLDVLKSLGSYSGGIFDAILKLAEMKINEGNFAQASSNIKQLSDLAKNMEKIQSSNIKKATFTSKFKDIKSAINEIRTLSIPKVAMNLNDISNLAKKFDSLDVLLQSIERFSSRKYVEINTENIKKSISQISDVVNSLKEISLPDVTKSIKASLSVENAQNIGGVLDSLIAMIPKFSQLTTMLESNPIDKEKVISSIKTISDTLGAINVMGLANGDGGSLGYNLKQFVKAKDIENAIQSFYALISLVKKCVEMQNVFTENDINFEELKQNISKVGTMLSDIVSSDKFEVDQEKLSLISSSIDTLSNVISKLSSIGKTQIDFEAINTMIKNIGTVITNIKSISEADQAQSIVAQIEVLLTKFNELISTLNGLNGKFQETGMNWGTSLYTGFEESDVSGKTVEHINSIIETIKAIDFKPVGTKYGNDIYLGFRSSVSKLPSALSGAISNLYAYSNSFANAGSSLGNSFANSFNNAVSNLKTPSIPKGKTQKKANGGLVEYFAKGGSIFKPHGTDTVPAMLTQGEYVVRKNAVDSIGVRFLDKINSMDFKGAFHELMNSHSSYSIAQNKNTTINNYTYNYDNRKVSVSGGNERQQILRAGHFLRGMA